MRAAMRGAPARAAATNDGRGCTRCAVALALVLQAFVNQAGAASRNRLHFHRIATREGAMVSEDFIKQLKGYGLTTATILYRMPDHPSVLQTFIWQQYDVAPRFPVLRDFLDFWRRELDGPLHSVVVAHSRLLRPAEIVNVNGVLTLH